MTNYNMGESIILHLPRRLEVHCNSFGDEVCRLSEVHYPRCSNLPHTFGRIGLILRVLGVIQVCERKYCTGPSELVSL